MKLTRRDVIRDVVRNTVMFTVAAGSAGAALPAMIPPAAKGEPVFALLRTWQEAERAEHALETRWYRAILRLIPPEYRADPWKDPERIIWQAFDDPKVERLRSFADAAKEHEKTIRQQIVNTRSLTLDGVVAKLRKGPNDDLVRSALADLERIAKSAA